MPLFSIITVSYNSQQTITKTIDSVLNQTCKDFEYIIIDGNSSDNTISIIKSYEKKFGNKLRWISEKDKGIYDAMNKGITLSMGDFIWLVNSDDWLEIDALNQVSKKISEIHDVDNTIITGWMNVVDSSGNIQLIGKSSRSSFEKALRKYSMGVCHPATIVPKRVYESIGLFDDRYFISGDIDFILRCAENGKEFLFLDVILTNMLNAGISNQLPIKKNWHDWKLRYSVHCTSKGIYYFFLMKSLCKLLLRKIVPVRIINLFLMLNVKRGC